MAETKEFNPNEHLLRIQGKDYLPVRWRLVWFHQETGPRAGYVTVELEYDRQNGFAKYFTIAWDGKDETWRHVKMNGIEVDVCGRVATGEGSETRADFNDYAEKAATKALGRALAGLSFGTQFSTEMDEKQRVADSPVERRPMQQPQQQRPAPTQKPMLQEVPKGENLPDDGSPPNDQQLLSLQKLCQALDRIMPAKETLTFVTASDMIRKLSKEYNDQRRNGKGA